MRWVVIVLLAFVASAWAQPAKTKAPSSDEVETPKGRFVANDDAPEWVLEWLEDLPQLKDREIIRLEIEHEEYVQQLENELQEKKNNLTRLKSQKTRKSSGLGYGRDSEQYQQYRGIRTAEDDVRETAKELREAKERNDPISLIIDLIKTNPMYLPVPPLELTVGSYGKLNGEFEVFQVLDEENMLVKYRDSTIWVSGIDTTNIVDEQQFKIEKEMRVTGTRQYNTLMGGTKKVFVVEFESIKDHVRFERDTSETMADPDQDDGSRNSHGS